MNAVRRMTILAAAFVLLAFLTLAAHWCGTDAPLRPAAVSRFGWLMGLGAVALVLVAKSGAVAALGDTLYPAQSILGGLAQDLSPTAHFLVQLRMLHPVLALAGVLLVALCSGRRGPDHLGGLALPPLDAVRGGEGGQPARRDGLRAGAGGALTAVKCAHDLRIARRARLMRRAARDWFRRTTWSEPDREEFERRLARARPSSRPQYLRIQAGHLAGAGGIPLLKAALGLLERLLTEYPDDVIHRASAHAQRAECLARLGEIPAAIEAFRMNLRAEGEFSGVRTNAWLDFGWLVVQHGLADLYGEVTGVFDGRGKDPSALAFPIQRYRYHAVRALLANAAGRRGEATQQAKLALEAQGLGHSGFRFHSDLGLVEGVDPTIHDQLTMLAG